MPSAEAAGFVGGQNRGARASLPRVLLVLAFALLVAGRMPGLWPEGRLWAEEGKVYLFHAWHDPWYWALVKVHTGYMNLPASVGTTLGVHWLPLPRVPLLTLLIALLLQVIPAALLAAGRIAWLRDWWKLALALLLVAAVPLSGEVWLNTITSQFHVLLAVAIVLASPTMGGAGGAFQGAVLIAAPLCGPSAALLLPLFVARAVIDRSPSRLGQAVLMLPAVLLQVATALTHPEPARSVGLDIPLVLTAIAGKQVLLPLLGPGLANRLTVGLPDAFAAGHTPWTLIATPLLFYGALALGAWRCRDRPVRWLLAAAVILVVVSYFAALTPDTPRDLLYVWFGNRYAYVPTVLTGLALLGIAATGLGATRAFAGIMVAWLLLTGTAYYLRIDPAFARGPSWGDEVRRWRTDPSSPLAIWPSGWHVRLEPRPDRSGG